MGVWWLLTELLGVVELTQIVKKYKEDDKGSSFSRYRGLYRLVDSNGDSYIESQDPLYIGEDITDSFFQVERGYEHRLDLISYKFYNTPMLWWVIAEVNGIHNPMLVDSGIVLRIPNISRLFGLGGVLG